MADTYTIQASNQTVTGTAAGEVFEFVSSSTNNTLEGGDGNDFFICDGTTNTLEGGDGNDTFEIYSYTNDGTNNILTGGNGNDTYIISTGLVSVNAANAETTQYNPYTSDAVNVTITDAKAGDSYYLRDYGIDGLNMSTTSDGVVISSKGGQINITMTNCDWNAVKDNLVLLDNAQGLLKTYTLEQAIGVGTTPSTPPAGISVAGRFLNVSSDFVGNVIMSSASANYTNNQVAIIDASQNNQAGMQLGGNSNANAIYAGQGGNALWGGEDIVGDYPFGGAGADIFLVGKGDGNDSVFSAEYQDTVQLYDVTIDDVRGCLYDANTKTILIGLNSGNDISVESNVNLWSAKFQLADGNTYRYNRMFDFWQKV